MDDASAWSIGVVRACDQFVAQVASIEEINRTVIPEMEERHIKSPFGPLDEIGQYLSPDEKLVFAKGARELANGILEVTERAKRGETGDPFSVKLHGSAGAALSHMVSYGARFINADPQHQLLRNSLLVSAVSGFEVLFGRIARAILDINRAAFMDSDHGFTLQQLSEFGSLDDAREFLIERQVTKLLYESVDGWDKWLKRASGGLTMSDLPVEWMTVREGFARRNLIVHADGVANQIYLGALRNLDSNRNWGVKLNEKLSADGDYLSDFLQELMALGRILSVGIGIRMRKRDEQAFLSSLQGDTYRSVRSGHWKAAIHTSEYTLRHSLPRNKKIGAQVSSWVARKALFGVDQIRPEVETWDVTGLAPELSHYKHVLLNETEAAVTEIRKLLEMGKLTAFEIAVDPLYEQVRKFIVNTSAKPISHEAREEI
ncbi:hypothetical protein [Streptomyces sp. NPDC026092]|uniref:hypothetical protein n=1 Tax=Streptomyces sp. NPDC026092 TaxID=3154797 RepID=UPI00340170FE